MPSEHEFLQQRLQMVRRQLHTAERDVVYDGHGRGRKATVADEVNQENRSASVCPSPRDRPRPSTPTSLGRSGASLTPF